MPRIEMKEISSNLSEAELENLTASDDKIYMAVLLTDDGFLVSGSLNRQFELSTVSAMMSSMMSLSEAVTSNLKLGGCKHVLIEADEGLVTCMRVSETHVMAVASAKDVDVRALFGKCRKASKILSVKLKAT